MIYLLAYLANVHVWEYNGRGVSIYAVGRFRRFAYGLWRCAPPQRQTLDGRPRFIDRVNQSAMGRRIRHYSSVLLCRNAVRRKSRDLGNEPLLNFSSPVVLLGNPRQE
jgi:hypothetical protein